MEKHAYGWPRFTPTFLWLPSSQPCCLWLVNTVIDRDNSDFRCDRQDWYRICGCQRKRQEQTCQDFFEHHVHQLHNVFTCTISLMYCCRFSQESTGMIWGLVIFFAGMHACMQQARGFRYWHNKNFVFAALAVINPNKSWLFYHRSLTDNRVSDGSLNLSPQMPS